MPGGIDERIRLPMTEDDRNPARDSQGNSDAWSLNANEEQTLLTIANDAIASGVKTGQPLAIRPDRYSETLLEPGATFVTLKLNQQLRGCIGSLEARHPLVEDVAHNAFSAAFRDPRFPPVGFHELLELKVSISVLPPAVEMQFESQADVLQQIRPGVDGLILEDRGRRGTFLPAVWEQLPTTELFFAQLKRKAGLPADHWSDSVRIWRYESRSIE